jgi:hypothetical protein
LAKAELHLTEQSRSLRRAAPKTMESTSNIKVSKQARQLSMLKIVSRLLAHELHSQSSAKTITLSRDEVIELQTCVDLYIEEVGRRSAGAAGGQLGDPPLVGARSN